MTGNNNYLANGHIGFDDIIHFLLGGQKEKKMLKP